MTKTGAYTSKEAEQHLEGSLRRLRTDYIDLWQVHAIVSDADTDNRIKNGILELMLEARQSGKVRHIGFTGHTHPSVHLHMLKQSRKTDLFDTCQMPVNVMDAGFHSFINKVLPALTERKIGVLAMKTLAEGRFYREMIEDEKYRDNNDAVIPDRISLTDALYYAWSLPVSVIITGASIPEHVSDKVELARSFVKLDHRQMEELIGKVADLASFAVEEYKQIPEE
jgi:predicted aldo/keto reductase-like oxidoreductase